MAVQAPVCIHQSAQPVHGTVHRVARAMASRMGIGHHVELRLVPQLRQHLVHRGGPTASSASRAPRRSRFALHTTAETRSSGVETPPQWRHGRRPTPGGAVRRPCGSGRKSSRARKRDRSGKRESAGSGTGPILLSQATFPVPLSPFAIWFPSRLRPSKLRPPSDLVDQAHDSGALTDACTRKGPQMANPRPTPKPENLHPPWPPGTSGNPAGYSRGRRISDAIERLIEECDQRQLGFPPSDN